MDEHAGIAAGFAFSFVVLMSALIISVIGNFFVPAAVAALNATASSLNVTNNPSPQTTFHWAIIAVIFVEALEAFLVGRFGEFPAAIGFLIGIILILALLGGFVAGIAPGVPITLYISIIVVFLGAITSG